jgi:hypothetical protein
VRLQHQSLTRCVLSDYAHGCACVTDRPYTRCGDSLIVSMGSSMLRMVEENNHHRQQGRRAPPVVYQRTMVTQLFGSNVTWCAPVSASPTSKHATCTFTGFESDAADAHDYPSMPTKTPRGSRTSFTSACKHDDGEMSRVRQGGPSKRSETRQLTRLLHELETRGHAPVLELQAACTNQYCDEAVAVQSGLRGRAFPGTRGSCA